jgi:thiopurine S-methyltransferase
MEFAEWGARWRDGQIGFHQAAFSDYLEKYADDVFGAGILENVLVPLCGKSLDMVFLAERAQAVVGVEYVDQAVRDFFAEQALYPKIGTEAPLSFRAGKYTVFAADFFEVSIDDIGVVDAIFDRASLVALDAETRVRYANHIASLQASGTKTLLITFDYDQEKMSGPPFAVSDVEVERLFSANFVVEHLESRAVLDRRFRERGLSAITESVFSLTRS